MLFIPDKEVESFAKLESPSKKLRRAIPPCCNVTNHQGRFGVSLVACCLKVAVDELKRELFTIRFARFRN